MARPRIGRRVQPGPEFDSSLRVPAVPARGVVVSREMIITEPRPDLLEKIGLNKGVAVMSSETCP
jgi:hypothetical protein